MLIASFALLLAAAPVFSQDTLSTVFTVGEVVVRGQRLSTVEAAATGTQIGQEDIRARADQTLDAALAALPGLETRPHPKGYTRVRLRGFDQDRVAILMDGVPLADVYSADLDLADVPLLNVARIVVDRGTSSALYGTSGGAGVINVITRRPERPYLQARAQSGQYGNRNLDLAAGAPRGRAYFWLTGSLLRAGGFRPSRRLDSQVRREWFDKFVPYELYGYTFDQVALPGKDSYLDDTGRWEHSDSRKWEVAGKVGYAFRPRWEAGLVARYDHRNGRSNTYEPNAYSDYKAQYQIWKDPLFTLATPQEVKKAAFRERAFVWPGVSSGQVAPYLWFEGEKVGFRSLGYRSWRQASEVGYASIDHLYSKDQAAVLAGDEGDPYRDLKSYGTAGVNALLSLKPRGQDQLSLAVLWRSDWFAERQQALSAEESPHIAATSYGLRPYYVQYLEAAYLTLAAEEEVRLSERLSLSAGLSYDAQWLGTFKRRHDLFVYEEAYRPRGQAAIAGTRDALSPVLGLVCEGRDGRWKLRTSAARKVRFPSLGEYAKIDSLHDRQLKPEKIFSASAGGERAWGRFLRWSADYYYCAVRDRIEKIAGGTEPPVNIDEIVSQGVETSLSGSAQSLGPVRAVRLTLGYVYLRARSYDDSPEETVDKGRRREGVPAHQFILDLRGMPLAETTLAIWGEHTRGQVGYAMRERPAPDDPAVAYSTAYFQTTPLHQPVKVNLKIARRVRGCFSVYLLGQNLLDDYNSDPFNPGPGRSFYLGWEYER